MKELALAILFIVNSPIVICQAWTEPINISNMDGYDSYPDMTIDKNGVLHCVWVHTINSDFRKIFYAKSIDDGNTWDTPTDISMNNYHSLMRPHIVTDTNGGLYVSYDYFIENPEQTQIHIRYFDGASWGDSIVITTDMPGAQHNRLTIDYNNRLYCFWFHDTNGGTIFYKYFENSIWSETFTPYDNNDLYFLDKAVVDSNNNLICAGIHHFEDENGYDDRIVYFDNIGGQWNEIYQLSDNTSWNGVDIDLDSEDLPHLTWWQYTTDTIPVTYGIIYSFYNGNDWSINEQISENSYNQRIQMVNNEPYVLCWKSGVAQDTIVLYNKLINIWGNEVVLLGDFIVPEVFLYRNNKFYLVFFGEYENEEVDIYFMSRVVDTTVTLIENYYDNYIYSIYPNPFHYTTNIVFNLHAKAPVNLSIYTIQGSLIKQLISNSLISGQHEITWDGTDNNGKKLNTSLYIVKLSIGNKIQTKLLILNQ